jgi:hypothetical protein
VQLEPADAFQVFLFQIKVIVSQEKDLYACFFLCKPQIFEFELGHAFKIQGAYLKLLLFLFVDVPALIRYF